MNRKIVVVSLILLFFALMFGCTSSDTFIIQNTKLEKLFDGNISGDSGLIPFLNLDGNALEVFSGFDFNSDTNTLSTNCVMLGDGNSYCDATDFPNPDLSGYVPYTGATQNVILGSNDLGIGYPGNPFTALHVDKATTAIGSGWGEVALTSNDSVAINKGGNISFGGKYSGNLYADWAGVAGLKENAKNGNYAGYLAFYTRQHGTNTAEKMRITSTGLVGINNNDPKYTLDVKGRGALRRNTSSDALAWDFFNTTGATMGTFFAVGATNQFLTGAVAGDTGFRAMGGRFLIGAGPTAGLEPPIRMTFLPDGKIGIGTVTPSEALDIVGDVEVSADIHNLSDTGKHYFGAGDDASIEYNGTNLVVNPKVVGSGILDVQGILQTDGYNSADGTTGLTYNNKIVKDVNIDGTFYCDMNFKNGLLVESDC